MSQRKTISTDRAPAAIGPYSQAVLVDGWLFGSGQIALDPESGEMVADGDIVREAERVMENVTAVLAAAGCTLADVVKTTVYLADMNQFGEVNKVYERHFGEHKPARATIQVARLPKAAAVEIDFIARKA